MPWSLEVRDGRYCVVKQGESSPVPGGCHDTRADAIKHQRALYASESRVASMYAELDALPDVAPEIAANDVPIAVPHTSPVMAEILALLARDQQEKSLVASVAESQSLMSQQFQEAAAERQALVAALGRMGSPTINVPAPEVNITVPEMNLTVPPTEVNVTVESPAVHVPAPNITVQPAEVNVTLPETRKTVTIQRDPLTRLIESATVEGE